MVSGTEPGRMDETIRYLEATHPNPNPLLLELEQQARRDGVPLVSRSLGRLLSVLVHSMQANRIVEIGTAYGYATLWMALALPPAGKLWTFDPDIERTEVARAFFERAELEGERVEIINQPASDVIPIFPQRNLDIVFVDADVASYGTYLELCLPMLKLSGLIIFHNVLPQNIQKRALRSKDAASLNEARHFNDLFLGNTDLDATILPIAGGTAIGARIR